MNYIIQILINAGVILGLAQFLPKIQVKNYSTAIVAAVIIGILNVFIGWIIRMPANVVTLGLLTALVRILVTALMIKATDRVMSGFNVEGFQPAVIIAVAIAIVNYILGMA